MPIAAATDVSVSVERPRSAVSHGVGIAGLIGLAAWFLLARHFGMNGTNAAYASVFACGVPMVLWSVLVDKVHLNPTTGIDWGRAQARHPGMFAIVWLAIAIALPTGDFAFGWSPAKELAMWAGLAALALLPWLFALRFDRCADSDERLAVTRVKLVGLWATWAIIAFAYVVLRYYWAEPYLSALHIFAWLIGPLVLLSVPYLLIIDRRLIEPRDGCWQFGQWLIGNAVDDAGRAQLFAHLRTWAVKGFFTAFMVSIVPGIFTNVLLRPVDVIFSNPVEFAAFFIAVCYIVDVHLATVGYTLTMRPLDAHIREANPYGMAWVAALICYPPFVLMNPGGPLNYQVGAGEWHQWLSGWPPVMWVWAALMIALTAVYAWATMAFGIRFSNLTHRGILTHGPYAWTRHPAYVAKNSYWWLATLPFLPLSGSVSDAVRNTALLAAVSGVYYWRAKTEEKQLLADPAYRAYWDWAQAHAPVPRFFTWLNDLKRPIIVLEPAPDRPSPEKIA